MKKVILSILFLLMASQGGWCAIAQVQSTYSNNVSGGTSFTFSFSAPTAGDILIAAINCDWYGTVSPPDGTWYIIDDTGEYTQSPRAITYWHLAQSGETGSYAFTFNYGGTGILYEFSGVNKTTPINGHGVTSYTSPPYTTLSTPSVVPTAIGTYPLAFLTQRFGNPSPVTVSTNWTLDVQAYQYQFAEFSAYGTITTDTTTGISNTFTISDSGDGYNGNAGIILLAPTPATPTPHSTELISNGKLYSKGNLYVQ